MIAPQPFTMRLENCTGPNNGAVSTPKGRQKHNKITARMSIARVQEILEPSHTLLSLIYNIVWLVLEAEYLVRGRSTSLLIHEA